MSINCNPRKVKLILVVLAAALSLPAAIGSALAAEEVSKEKIIEALRPADRATRGLTTATDTARADEETRFVNTLRNRSTRSLTSDDREKIASIAKKKPSIDLEINFEFNSGTIATQAMSQVKALGQALASDDLKGGTFLVAGHTDGKGGEAYNQALSERRADAVKRFLSAKYGIAASRLVTVGYGKAQLKTPSNPSAGENRRVQLVNMTDK